MSHGSSEHITISVKGNSMLPLLWPGTTVRASLGSHDLKAGDVVVIFQAKHLVLHRIMRMGEGKILTQGDNRGVDDGWCAKSDILGVVPGVVFCRFHFPSFPRVLRAPFRVVWVAMLPIVRRVFWLGCAISRPLRRALTHQAPVNSLRA